MALDPITDLYYLFRYILFHSMISRSKKLFTIDIEKVAPIKLHSNNNKFISQLLINFSCHNDTSAFLFFDTFDKTHR